MKHKNSKGTDGFELVVFDLYDIIIDFLEGKNFIEKCCEFEKKRGIQRKMCIRDRCTTPEKYPDDIRAYRSESGTV